MKTKRAATSIRALRRRPRPARHARGFSLAEVLLALAITAFALLALVGVLPEGLQSLQNAQRKEAEARIVQHLTARYQMKTWTELDSLVGARDETTYDANGAWVEEQSTDVVFRARSELLSGLPLPNETGASPYLRRLQIRITGLPSNGSALDTPSLYRERFVTLVDLDKTPTPVTTTTGNSTTTSGGTANP